MDDATLTVVVGLGVLLYYLYDMTPTGQTINVGVLGENIQQPPVPSPPSPPSPLPPQPPSSAPVSGDGSSESNPIMAMPISDLVGQVTRSLAYWGRGDVDYWVSHEDHAGQFSNGLWYVGHNAYWFDRMDPNNEGSSDPYRAGQPAPV